MQILCLAKIARFDATVTMRVAQYGFAFGFNAMADGTVRVRPVTFPQRRLGGACAGAQFSLLTDGDGHFIWVANADEPKTMQAAVIIARKWAHAILLDRFPDDWPRDRSIW